MDKGHQDSRDNRQERQLWVGNIDWDSTEGDIETVFTEFGEVESVKMPKTDDGRSRGFAFVIFKEKESVQAGFDKGNGMKFKGRDLVVKKSDERALAGSRDRGQYHANAEANQSTP